METNSIKIEHKNFSIKHKNKSWGENNWIDLVNQLKDNYLLISSVHQYSLKIEGVYISDSMDFRLASSIMNLCDIYLGQKEVLVMLQGSRKESCGVLWWVDRPKNYWLFFS